MAITHEQLESALGKLNQTIMPTREAALRGAGANGLVVVLVEAAPGEPVEFIERRISPHLTKAEALVFLDAFERGYLKGTQSQ